MTSHTPRALSVYFFVGGVFFAICDWVNSIPKLDSSLDSAAAAHPRHRSSARRLPSSPKAARGARICLKAGMYPPRSPPVRRLTASSAVRALTAAHQLRHSPPESPSAPISIYILNLVVICFLYSCAAFCQFIVIIPSMQLTKSTPVLGYFYF